MSACISAAAVCWAGAIAALQLPGRQKRAADISISTPERDVQQVTEEL
jgi:hypothetical protein